MLVGTPLPVKLSAFVALGPALWIRRVLVRSQEGQSSRGRSAYAAADDVGPTSRHFKDLLALKPTPADLEAAREWIATQDPSPAVAQAVAQVIAHVRQASR
jgi:hypothetical protein